MRSFLFALLVVASASAHAEGLDRCARLYADCVRDGFVDYTRVASHPDKEACRQTIANATPPTKSAPPDRGIAFWADVYNLVSILAISDDGQRWSPRQDGKILFRDRKFPIAGESLTLDQVERDKLAAFTHDPHVEFLLSCGSRSCAPLPSQLLSTGNGVAIEATMLVGMRRWFANPDNLRVRRDAGVVEVGQLLQLDWHGSDFERAGISVTKLVADALDERHEAEDAAALRSGKLHVVIRPYDWRVNRLRRAYVLP
jgi:hypothetical protein